MRYFVVILAIMIVAGCTLAPLNIRCKGKGVLAFQGGPYAGTVQGDCGEGFEYSRDGGGLKSQ